MRLAAVLAMTTAACAGCGGGDDATDARPVDAAVDGVPTCTAPQAFTGELVDFDSSPASFLGVFDAAFTVRGVPSCSVRTAPNGRFVMMIPAADTIVDIDPPDDYLAGLVVVPRATVTAPMAGFSLRGLTAARAASLSADLGELHDPARATVIVYQAVDAVAVTLTGANGATATTDDGSTWAAGNDLTYVAFTNVELGAGTQTLAGLPSSIGVGAIPVEAGKVTYVTTLSVLE